MILDNLVSGSGGKRIALTGQKGAGNRLCNRAQMIDIGTTKGKWRDG